MLLWLETMCRSLVLIREEKNHSLICRLFLHRWRAGKPAPLHLQSWSQQVKNESDFLSSHPSKPSPISSTAVSNFPFSLQALSVLSCLLSSGWAPLCRGQTVSLDLHWSLPSSPRASMVGSSSEITVLLPLNVRVINKLIFLIYFFSSLCTSQDLKTLPTLFCFS